ncbi:hypothetical protein [Kitasatospora sp. GP82]|uniref:hypothetical protein n=1 Tax=Kitasatospora sp. GP82 TaxID=3035089 RepID=UPI002475FA92|nr:hypothetical protein [Kitasatospora sp. GP82]MDH6128148.1 hypothetical protein [Kitasatospora sp. GP82]
MTDVFAQELREQLDQARLDLASAREAGDDDGVDAYRGRIASLLRIAERHGIDIPHTRYEEGEEED